MLAGRKLLLADDSITIQKVVELTFADEGVHVIAVGTGTEAIERLEEIEPDVVLADVFMPGLNGYQVCEHIKRNERLRHIPVMLLVGSFEPFDEAEAHRVGADDTLTKPFQSIRNLVDKVGGLLRGEPAAHPLDEVDQNPAASTEAPAESSVLAPDEVRTMELPKLEMAEVESQSVDVEELELMTADTRRLTPELLAATQRTEIADDSPIEVEPDEAMETEAEFVTNNRADAPMDFGDALLDLGQLDSPSMFGADDDILDIDLDAPVIAKPRAARVQTAVAEVASVAVIEREVAVAEPFADMVEWEAVAESPKAELATAPVVEEMLAALEFAAEPQLVEQQPAALESMPAPNVTATPTGQISLDQLSAEAVDAIARRVVAQLSEKAVQEIAWEVVPQLAELMIKRRLEEKDNEAT